MKSTDADLYQQLRHFLVGQSCVVGVGNRDRADDGVGPYVVQLRDPRARGTWIDAGETPENVLEQICNAKPSRVVFIDAVRHCNRLGDCLLIAPGDLDDVRLSTHAGSLGLLAEYLRVRSNAEMRVLGVQPESLRFGERMSRQVQQSAKDLAAILSEILLNRVAE